MDEDEPVRARYDDTNRAFLQALMARGSITLKQAKPILAEIFTILDGPNGAATQPDDVSEEDFESYIAAAAEALSPFDIEIRSTAHQVSKTRVWAIVNSTSDLLTQGASTRTTEELQYIKRVIDAMFDTYNTPRREIMGVTSMQAAHSNVRKAGGRQSVGGEAASTQTVDKGVTSQQAEKILGDLVAEGWFERSKEGWYTLSPRALMELRAWLVEAYNDSDDPDEWQRIKMCMACSEIITIGQRCPNEDCNARLHDICQASYWVSKTADGSSKKCPKCYTPWTGLNWVGEKAETTRESYQKGRRKSKKRQEAVVEEDAEDEELEEEVAAQSDDDDDADGDDE
ncbi:RING-like domain-containing protein [Phlyctema vagabunda]|uniref:Non-structural maintenance of chromosomes element 1 homolog n=1 Tax=Phlyctema vagabunda TaxID=108571 RepID=A0ABR4P9X5_9HELO